MVNEPYVTIMFISTYCSLCACVYTYKYPCAYACVKSCKLLIRNSVCSHHRNVTRNTYILLLSITFTSVYSYFLLTDNSYIQAPYILHIQCINHQVKCYKHALVRIHTYTKPTTNHYFPVELWSTWADKTPGFSGRPCGIWAYTRRIPRGLRWSLPGTGYFRSVEAECPRDSRRCLLDLEMNGVGREGGQVPIAI